VFSDASLGCCMDLVIRTAEQPPNHDNAKQIGKTFSKQILTIE